MLTVTTAVLSSFSFFSLFSLLGRAIMRILRFRKLSAAAKSHESALSPDKKEKRDDPPGIIFFLVNFFSEPTVVVAKLGRHREQVWWESWPLNKGLS